jgi:hypothetical protein
LENRLQNSANYAPIQARIVSDAESEAATIGESFFRQGYEDKVTRIARIPVCLLLSRLVKLIIAAS